MHRTNLLFALIATAALLASGCDRGDKPPTAVGGNANAVVGDEEVADMWLGRCGKI